MPEVNVFKGQFIANIFSLVFAAGRACLLPFLTIYFYYLGLSPTQTGLLLGLKSFTSVWSALCWTKYVATPKRKRCVLVFSILVLMLTHLAMMLMPAMNSSKTSSFCLNPANQSALVMCNNSSSTDPISCQRSNVTDVSSFTNPMTSYASGNASDNTSFPLSITSVSPGPLPNTTVSDAPKGHSSAKLPVTTVDYTLKSDLLKTPIIHSTSTSKFHESFKSSTKRPSEPSTKETGTGTAAANVNDMPSVTADVTENSAFGTENDESDLENDEQEQMSHKNKKQSTGKKRPRRVVKRTLIDDEITNVATTTPDALKESPVSKTREESNSQVTDDDTGNLVKSFVDIQHQVFVALLVLVLVGEMFSSPTELLTDDLWLRFLDSFEQLDKSHIPKLWASLGAALTPWAVVLVINYLPCVLPVLHIPRILFHFLSFEVIVGLALLLSFCFPVVDSDSSKAKKWSRLFRGLRIVCGDVHSFVCMFTVIVVGFVYGFINSFLFWLMHQQSSNGSELPLGIALTAAAGGEFFMSFVAGWIVQKLKCPISIILGLLVLCARCLLYSFLFNPWIAVVGEAGHMLSHTIIWSAVQNYPAFRVNPLVMDTSAHTALSVVYSGFGISSGCMVAGLCYSWLGPDAMFQIAASVAGTWCLVFAVVYKCCGRWRKQQRVRYTKIAQEDMADSDLSDDDWLESAVKRKK